MNEYIGIIAMDKARNIGKGNSLPWPKNKEDMAFFKNTTTGHRLIIGRKSFESLPTPFLKNRHLYVLSRSNSYGWTDSFYEKGDLKHQVSMITDINQIPQDNNPIFVCGGKEIYNLLENQINQWLVSYIEGEYEGDVKMEREFEKDFTSHEPLLITPNLTIKRFWARLNTQAESAVQSDNGNTSTTGLG